MQRVVLLFLFLCACVAQGVCAGMPLPDRACRLGDVAYKAIPGDSLRLDIYLADSADVVTPRPVMVYIHGGSWVGGNKRELEDPVFLRPWLYALLRNGYDVVSVSYRLAGGTQNAVYPEPIADCKDAVRWVRSQAARYGFDTQRIAVGGASAGGHLAMMVAYTCPCLAVGDPALAAYSADVNCCVDIYGPTQVNKILYASLPKPAVAVAKWFFPASSLKLRATLLGSFTTETAAHPRRRNRQCKHWSPITHVAMATPTIIFHGDKDATVPYAQSRRLKRRLRNLGIPVEMMRLRGEDHCFPTATPQMADSIARRTIDFLACHNRPQSGC